MENFVETVKEWFGRPEVKQGFTIFGIISVILGILIVVYFDDESLFRMNSRYEILLPWQDANDVGIPIPLRLVMAQSEETESDSSPQ